MRSFIVGLSALALVTLFATESFAQLRCVHIGGYIFCYGSRAQATTQTTSQQISPELQSDLNDLAFEMEHLIKQAEKAEKEQGR